MADPAKKVEVQSDRRRAERAALRLNATIREPGRSRVGVRLIDISTHGCRIEATCTLSPDTWLLLKEPVDDDASEQPFALACLATGRVHGRWFWPSSAMVPHRGASGWKAGPRSTPRTRRPRCACRTSASTSRYPTAPSISPNRNARKRSNPKLLSLATAWRAYT